MKNNEDIEKVEQHSARNVFLTYPKQSKELIIESKELLSQKLKTIVLNHNKAQITYLLVAHEESDSDHAYEHYHVVISFDRLINIRDCHFFDIDGVHGSYEAAKSVSKAINYTKKHNDFIEEKIWVLSDYPQWILADHPKAEALCHFLTESLAHNIKLKKIDTGSTWELLEELRNIVAKCSEHQKAVYSINKRKIDTCIFNILPTFVDMTAFRHGDYHISDFNIPEGCKKWMQDYKDTKTLFIYGESGIGKTEFAESISKNFLRVCIPGCFRHLNMSHDIILFDFYNWREHTRKEQIELVDVTKDVMIKIKYGHVWLERKIPRIILNTVIPKETFKFYEKDDEISKHLFIVHADDSLIKNKS